MGQMTYALMYGCKQRPPKDLEGEWYSLIEEYKPGRGPSPDSPHGDGDPDIIGFWVAVGASGEDGAPDLYDVALDEVPRAYKRSYERAVKAWSRFAAWAAERGVALKDPKLYLVQTEVA